MESYSCFQFNSKAMLGTGGRIELERIEKMQSDESKAKLECV